MTKGNTMIQPTVGRVLWYYESGHGEGDQPFAAHIAYVHNDRLVNLMVIDHNGYPSAKTSVTLVQDGDACPDGPYCVWMPYQKGQAAKTEQLERVNKVNEAARKGFHS